jgi:hypothetical protein
MSRPPHSSSSPSERAAAVAYILRTCIGPKTQVAEAALVIVKKSLVLHVRAALQPLCSLPAAVSLPAPAPLCARRACVRACLGHGISPASVILRHWYGFSLVSSAHASPSVDLPSLPPMATRNRLATRLSVCAYRALGPAPCTSTLMARGGGAVAVDGWDVRACVVCVRAWKRARFWSGVNHQACHNGKSADPAR